MLKRDSSVSLTSPSNRLSIKRLKDQNSITTNIIHDKNDKTIDLSIIKVQNELNDTQNNFKFDKADLKEYKQKNMTHDDQVNSPTNIDFQTTISNFPSPFLELPSKVEEPTITIDSTNNFITHKKSIYSPQTPQRKKGNKLLFFSNQNDVQQSSQTQPNSPKLRQRDFSLEDNQKSPVEKYLNQLHPLPQITNMIDYQKHLKKQDNLRTYGTMFSQPKLIRLKPQMSERKQTYEIFHQSSYKKLGTEMNFKGRANRMQENKKNKKGIMLTNEFWSDSYYQKVFKSSCLGKIEEQINLEKLQTTAKEAQKNMNKYFEHLFEQKPAQKQPQVGTRRRITINQNDFLNSYINNAIATSILSSPRIPLATIATEQTEQLIEDTTSQNSILIYQRSPSERSIQHEGIKRQPSISLNNQNIFQQFIKKSAFSQIQGGEQPYIQDNSDAIQNIYPKDILVSQKQNTNQYISNDQEQQHTQPQTTNETKFTVYDQIIDTSTFQRSSHFDKESFRLQKQLLTDRSHNSKNISIRLRTKGNETSRNTSSDFTLKESPFFNKKTYLSDATPFSLDKQYLKGKSSQLNSNNTSLKKSRRTSSDYQIKTQGNEQQNSQEQSQIQKYIRYKTEIKQILQDCQAFQEDTNLIKSNLKFKVKEQAMINQISKDFVNNKKKKEDLKQFHSKEIDSREVIDQKRKYMHSYNLVRAVEFNKQSS